MTLVREFVIPGLATVMLDTRSNERPVLEVVLDKSYRGDLDDIALRTPGPDNVYLRCDHASAINNPELAKFIEVLTHWDHTGDGVPDCDDVIKAIEDALYQSREAPEELHRPHRTPFERFCMFFMPPAPERHIVYSFGSLQPRFRWYHHAAALPMITVFVGLMLLQEHFLPFMKYSLVTGSMAISEALGFASWMGIIAMFILLSLGKKPDKDGGPSSRHTFGLFSKAALYEEQVWREGAEKWSWSGRMLSCLSFGLIHMTNLIYPLASILPLAIGGGVFMAVYLHTYRKTRFRRSAVLASTIWHRVYNRIALAALFISLATWIGLWLAGGLLVVFAIYVIAELLRGRNTSSTNAYSTHDVLGQSE